MDANIIIGEESGRPVRIDIEELLATRLLVQGNSGSGKSHLLRRLLEESAGLVQQVVIDPEGDFVTLADHFDHVVIDGAAYSEAEIDALAGRIREHRASVVLSLDGLEVEQQIRCAARFLNALFDAPRDHWFPALVVVDEAQMFAPAVGGEIGEDTRRMTLSAMTNLMCRGRKRGLAGIVATQRLAKLAKNVAAEASNFLMGRTFLDIDMQRAADLLGMERRQAEAIRDLERGSFLGLGPAISRRPISVRIGSVRSASAGNGGGLLPLPSAPVEDMKALLHAEMEQDVARPQPRAAIAPPPPAADIAQAIERAQAASPSDAACDHTAPDLAVQDEHEAEQVGQILDEMIADDGASFRSASALYQNFLSRCRARRIHLPRIDMGEFRRRFAIASARIDDLADDDRDRLLTLSENVGDDLLAPFLVIARAALDGLDGPDEDELARAYGTSSPGRIRRVLDHFEREGLIVVREEFGGGRTIQVPALEGAR